MDTGKELLQTTPDSQEIQKYNLGREELNRIFDLRKLTGNIHKKQQDSDYRIKPAFTKRRENFINKTLSESIQNGQTIVYRHGEKTIVIDGGKNLCYLLYVQGRNVDEITTTAYVGNLSASISAGANIVRFNFKGGNLDQPEDQFSLTNKDNQPTLYILRKNKDGKDQARLIFGPHPKSDKFIFLKETAA